MILLDTNHVTYLQRPESERAVRLTARLAAQPDPDIATTIISVEESFRGWMARLGAERQVARQVPLYEQLGQLFEVYNNLTIVPFDEAALAHFVALRRLRISAADKKIASIALARNCLLLTANARDFAQVPTLDFADWSA